MRALVLEELLEKVRNRFLLTVAAARRARQIKDGAKKLIDAPEDESAVIVALDEILEDKIKIEVGELTGQKLSEADIMIRKMTVKEPEVKEKKEEKKEEKAEKKPVKKAAKAGKKKKKSRSLAA